MEIWNRTIRYIYGGVNNLGYVKQDNFAKPPYTAVIEAKLTEGLNEIPVLMLSKLRVASFRAIQLIDDITLKHHLHISGIVPEYKSLDASLRKTIADSSKDSILYTINITANLKYYVASGVIFDYKLKPVAMCTWQIQRERSAEPSNVGFFSRPVLRIDPVCFDNSNAMEKLITSKLLKSCLNTKVDSFYVVPEWSGAYSKSIKVIIDKIPFVPRFVKYPSAKDSTSDYIDIVKQHISHIII